MVTPNVIVSPDKFKLVFGVNEDCTLELTNVGYDAIIYRLQTVAPDHYVVKHAKGVVRGNSATKIIITLNQRRIQEYDKSMTAAKIFKDDFLLECALLGENDVIEPRYANVSQLIKDKKTENPGSVLRKILRSQIFLDTSAAATTTPDPINSAAVESNQAVRTPVSHPQDTPASASSPVRRKADTKNDENPPLAPKEAQKKKPGVVETALATKARPKAGSRLNTLLILGSLIVAVVVWMLME
ncbi:unnamed protein product [Phytomonas sp. EM1]|nr:unnamed protein product [Phytomonas sp. EM1]|eukprot:CCW64585.1 unnamed protein product [Phytomonas sp. isolate EM1]